MIEHFVFLMHILAGHTIDDVHQLYGMLSVHCVKKSEMFSWKRKVVIQIFQCVRIINIRDTAWVPRALQSQTPLLDKSLPSKIRN